jgi:hypothetical protein
MGRVGEKGKPGVLRVSLRGVNHRASRIAFKGKREPYSLVELLIRG